MEQARREFGSDDPKTLRFLLLASAFSTGGRPRRRPGPPAGNWWRPGPASWAATTRRPARADGRRDPPRPGGIRRGERLLSRLRDDREGRALEPEKYGGSARNETLSLRRLIALAEVIARNLAGPSDRSRAERRAGRPGSTRPYRPSHRSPTAGSTPSEYSDGDGFAFDFADDHNLGRSHLIDDKPARPRTPRT